MKLNPGLRALCVVICLFLQCFPEPSRAGGLSKVDDILEGIATLNKKTRGLPDDKAVFKQTETFETLIKREPGLADSLRRRATKLDNAQSQLKKLNLPPGSKLADEFLSLPPARRYAVSQLAETTQIILKRADGADLLTRLDKSGLLLVQRFGNNVIEPVSFVVKNDELWNAAAATSKALQGIDPAQMKQLSEMLKKLPDPVNLRTLDSAFSNADRVRLSYQVLKKYGKKGFDNLTALTKKCWDLAKRHPKKALFGGAIAVVWLNPDLVLDPVGRLKDNAVRLVESIAMNFGEVLASVPVAVVQGMKRGAEAKVREYLPEMPAALADWMAPAIGWLATIAGSLLILFLIPFTRFIPKAIVGWVFRLFKSPFRRNRLNSG